MQAEPFDPLIGTTVDDRYLVLAKVARGGMSTVYLAKDVRLNRNIALKILHAHLATDNAFIERLQREAWSAASLSHPHVVQIHDHGVGAEHAYLVLEYIDGHTLRDIINSRAPLTPRQALDLLDPIVEGLAAAHAAGLVHRDVKPENVLVSRSGWVKIGDFGLSRAVTTTTSTGTLLGTVGYIAPELVNGDGGDARSDIYSAGIMLYELLTGDQPFRGQVPIAVAMQHVRDDVPAPSAAVPGLPSEMDELVRYMTEKDPDNRPANGASLLEDLRHIRHTLTPEELDAGGSGPGGGPAP
ncbi:protein kinase, partial [Arthrobacter sp.]